MQQFSRTAFISDTQCARSLHAAGVDKFRSRDLNPLLSDYAAHDSSLSEIKAVLGNYCKLCHDFYVVYSQDIYLDIL